MNSMLVMAGAITIVEGGNRRLFFRSVLVGRFQLCSSVIGSGSGARPDAGFATQASRSMAGEGVMLPMFWLP